MNIPADLKYTKKHEWARVEGDLVYVGITEYAQNSLGDIVFVELPSVGDIITSGEAFGVVESVKAASDIYSSLSGIVKEVNNELIDHPERINQNPYDSWMMAIEPSKASELEVLLDASAYEKLCLEEA